MRRSLLPLPLIACAAPALAQGGETILVTGRGLDPARGEEVYDVVTLERDRLANSPSGQLEEVLRDVAGFQLFRRSDARSANPTSQGATLRALGGNASSRALLILDGVPQSDPFGGWISWPAYDPRRLGRVRVMRGGGTGAAGPGALAGTIEMDSAAPDELAGLSARLAYGSRDGIDAFAGIGLPLGAGFLSASGAWARGDGFVPVIAAQRGAADRPSPYRQGSFALRAVAPVTGSAELQANFGAFTDRRERGTAFSAIATDGADASLRLVGRGRLPFSALVYVQTRDFSNLFAAANADRSAANLTLDQYSVPSIGLGARVEIRPMTGPTELRLGADWRETAGRTEELFFFVSGSPTRGRSAGGRTRTLGAFAELGLERGPFTLGAGARLDRWDIESGFLRERLLADGSPLADTAFPGRSGWEPTARAGAVWRVSPRLALRAAAYRGWRLPTLNELYRPFRIGAEVTTANAALAPERLEGAEAGLEWRPLEGARIGVTGFANRLDDAIANVTLAPNLRQRRNVDAVVSRGIEVDASLDLGAWRLAAGYSFADAEIDASGAALLLDGLRPAQTPRHSASATLSWQASGGAYAALTGRYTSSQYEDDLNVDLLPDAFTVDAIAVAPLTGALSIEARAEISATRASPPASPPPASSSAPPRARSGSACAGGSDAACGLDRAGSDR